MKLYLKNLFFLICIISAALFSYNIFNYKNINYEHSSAQILAVAEDLTNLIPFYCNHENNLNNNFIYNEFSFFNTYNSIHKSGEGFLKNNFNHNLNNKLNLNTKYVNNNLNLYTQSRGYNDSANSKVNYTALAENEITTEDLNNNAELYAKLNAQKTNSMLTNLSFVGIENLDLSSCNLENVNFASLFEFSSLKHINLCNNKLTENINLTSLIISFPNIQKVFLSGNLINLSSVPSFVLNNTYVEWGIQFSTTNSYLCNQNLTVQYLIRDSDFTSVHMGSDKLSSNSLQTVNIDFPKDITITTAINTGYSQQSYTQEFTLFSISPKYDANNRLFVNQFDSFPNAEQLFNISSNAPQCTFSAIFPSTSIAETSVVDVEVFLNNQLLETFVLYYQINAVSAADVVLVGNAQEIIATGENFVDSGIVITVNGVQQNFNKVLNYSLLTPNSYCIIYYVAQKNDKEFLKQNEVDFISTSTAAHFIVEYVVMDADGNIIKCERVVSVEVAKVSREEFKSSALYNQILLKLGKVSGDDVLTSDFQQHDYLDFSKKRIHSLNGFSQFNLKQQVVLDFSYNDLNSALEINQLLKSKPEIFKIYLLKNLFLPEEIAKIDADIREKCVFGFQQFSQQCYANTTGEKFVLPFYNDLENHFTIVPSQSADYTVTQFNTIVLNNFATYSFDIKYDFIPNKENLNVSAYFVYIEKICEQDTMVLGSSFVINGDKYFKFNGLGESLLFETDYNSNNLVVGANEINFTFKFYNDNVAYSSIILNVTDNGPPNISLIGDTTVYVKSVDEYMQTYDKDICVATDNSGGNNVTIDKKFNNFPPENGYGLFTVTYTATDLAGNKSSVVRNVYVGNVEIAETYLEVAYNSFVKLNINYITFNKSNFTVLYKQKAQSTFSEYQENTGILCDLFGIIVLDVQMRHKINTNLIYNFVITLNSTDSTAPVISLLGEKTLNIYAGAQFVEPGYQITDNTVNGIYTNLTQIDGINLQIKYFHTDLNGKINITTSLDTNKIGTYRIVYIASDNAQNTQTAERYVHITYYIIDNVKIMESALLDKYQVGKNVTFYVEIISDFITEPNPIIMWYVNDNLVKTTEGLSAEIVFDSEGTQKIKAVLINSIGEKVESQEISISLYKGSILEQIFMIVGIILGMLVIIMFIVYFYNRYKQRNFY